MKTLLAIFLFAILSSHSAFAEKVAPRKCVEANGCHKGDPKLDEADGGGSYVGCAPINGFHGRVEVALDAACPKCDAKTKCDEAAAMEEAALRPAKGTSSEDKAKSTDKTK